MGDFGNIFNSSNDNDTSTLRQQLSTFITGTVNGL